MMNLYRSIFILFSTLIVSASGATYTGRVIDNGTPAKPVANVTVSLLSASSAAYTDSTGKFTLNPSTANEIGNTVRQSQPVRFHAGKVIFSCAGKESIHLQLFTLNGRLAGSLLNRQFESGDYSVPFSSLVQGNLIPGLYMASIMKGNTAYSFSIMISGPKTGGSAAGAGYATVAGLTAPAKTGAAAENLSVYKMGYEPVAVPVSASSSDLGDIVIARTAKEAAIERKVDSILSLMSIDEKAGQMVQAQINFTNSYTARLTDQQIASMAIGSVFNGGSDASAATQANTPESWAKAIDRVQNVVLSSSTLKIPMIYAQDCVHGAAELDGCTVFPHNIGLGCTGDTALVAKVGRITAMECAGVGIRLNFWPCIASVRNERWGRTYEGFGETPEINAALGAAYIRGLQGDGDNGKAGAIAACAKHYVGDGGTNNGTNNGTTSLSEATMRAVHLPQYAASARELMATVMPSYHTWTRDGSNWKQTLDRKALTSILKADLGFDGFCVSDWDAVASACGSYSNSCVAQAVNAGLDMAMIVGDANCSKFISAVKAGVGDQSIPLSRVDDAVRRILRIKLRFGIFDHPLSDAALRGKINSTESKAVARECVRKSLVLLKNDNDVLPLKKTEKIVVVGPWAGNMGAQCGGWTISWQGSSASSRGIAGQTILQGLQSVGGSSVTYDENGTNLSGADKIVVVVGEKPYAETQGDVTSPDFSKCPNASLIETCFNSGKPVILVMITGRPMLIDTEIGWCKAIVAAWLPGGEGGGVADVLFGDYNFSGTLSHTWPASSGRIPINAGPVYADEPKGSGGDPLFPYGFGLRYN